MAAIYELESDSWITDGRIAECMTPTCGPLCNHAGTHSGSPQDDAAVIVASETGIGDLSIHSSVL